VLDRISNVLRLLLYRAAGTLPPALTGFLSSLGPQIVFTRFGSGADAIEDVALISTTTGIVRMLTSTNSISDVRPTWSPDGKLIVLARRTHDGAVDGLWTMDAEGRNLRSIPGTTNAGYPTWSPDGTRLAVARVDRATGNSGICLINTDGSGVAELTPPSGDDTPTWSAARNEVVFTRRLDNEVGRHLCAINLTTKVIRDITRPTAGRYDIYPNCSQRDDRIVFARSDRTTSGICVTNADGTGFAQLTTTPVGTEETLDTTPAWSSDGQWIAFSRSRRGGAEANLYIMRSRGASLRQLTFGTLANFDPSWRP
jgi:TolB protein